MNVKELLGITPEYLDIKLYISYKIKFNLKIKSRNLLEFEKYYNYNVVSIDIGLDCLKIYACKNGGNGNE